MTATMPLMRGHQIFRSFEKNYWDYYLELENEFLQTRKYVDFKQGNFKTYSVEFLKLYQAVCSEIDVIGKTMAMQANSSFFPDDKKNNILKWWFEIQDIFSIPYDGNLTASLNSFSCSLLDDIDIQPWANFRTEQYKNAKGAICYRLKAKSQTPTWWSDYNKVKHNRTSRIASGSQDINYTKANLGNLCSAFAALYALELAYMHAIGTKDDLEAFANYSKLFVKEQFVTSSEIEEMFDEVWS